MPEVSWEWFVEKVEPADTYSLSEVLAQIWHYSTFRGSQEQIIQALLQARDTLAILPTGGGKSLCFQLPALVHPGTTLVITPLVALMEDQVQALRKKRVAAAAYHGELEDRERQQVLEGMEEGRWTALYLSPEGLFARKIWERLACLRLARLVLDEAHCLATWGSGFRPNYRRLGPARRVLNLPTAAFTATATPATIKSICQVLQLKAPKIIRLSPYRPNLTLSVEISYTPQGRRQALLNFLKAHPQQAGLIYVRSRESAEQLQSLLVAQGHYVGYYHGGLGSQERRAMEQMWLSKKMLFLVCTSAFGMGIDHADLRWVLHFESPVSTEEYLQEIGRAGRDGNPATAHLLASEPTGWLDPTDKNLHRFFEAKLEQQQRQALHLVAKLPPPGQPTVLIDSSTELLQTFSLLEQAGYLVWLDPFHYQLLAKPKGNLLPPPQPTVQAMRDYPLASGCRWQFLLTSLGTLNTPPCGHCDACKKKNS